LRWAIAGLAVPWVQFTTLGTSFPLLAAVVCLLLLTWLGAKPLERVAGTLGAFALPLGCWSLVTTAIPSPTAELLAHYAPDALAEASWAYYVRLVGTADASAYDLAKLPTWAALAAVTIVALLAARPGREMGTRPASELP